MERAERLRLAEFAESLAEKAVHHAQAAELADVERVRRRLLAAAQAYHEGARGILRILKSL